MRKTRFFFTAELKNAVSSSFANEEFNIAEDVIHFNVEMKKVVFSENGLFVREA
jgi:hypothetical protein